MKKLLTSSLAAVLALALAVVLVVAMTGCGTASDSSASASAGSVEPSTGGMGNPWTYGTAEDMASLTDLTLTEPADVSDITYGYCDTLGMLEMTFTDEAGTEITARIEKTDALEDISGMDSTTIEWTTDNAEDVAGMSGEFKTCDDYDGIQYQLYTWYDETAGTSCSIMSANDSTVDLNGFDLLGYGYTIFGLQ